MAVPPASKTTDKKNRMMAPSTRRASHQGATTATLRTIRRRITKVGKHPPSGRMANQELPREISQENRPEGLCVTGGQRLLQHVPRNGKHGTGDEIPSFNEVVALVVVKSPGG
jgi:hypothetical protein